jgi:hypothetical protein
MRLCLRQRIRPTFADAVRRELGKNLVRAIKHSGDDSIPEPTCHESESSSRRGITREKIKVDRVDQRVLSNASKSVLALTVSK